MNKNKEKKELKKEKVTKPKTLINRTTSKLREVLDSQIKIKTASHKTNFTKKQQEFIKNNLWNSTSKIRIYFVRHWNTGIKWHQTPKDSLLIWENERFKRVSKKLIRSWVNKKNSYIFYDKNTSRVEESALFIQENLKISNNNIQTSIDWLDTTDKTHPNYSYRYLESSIVTSWFAFNLLKSLENKENFNIIMVLHRANIASLEQTYTNKWNEPLSLDFKWFTHWEIREIDIQMDWKWKSMDNQKEILFLTGTTVNDVTTSLDKKSKWQKKLKKIIQQFQSKELQIWELQNYINAYFKSNSELFKKYILVENYDIRVFCVLNLIKQWDLKFVKNNLGTLLDITKENKIILFINIILNQCSNKEKKELIKIIVNHPNLTKWLKMQSLEYFINYEKNIKKSIKKIRKNSLNQKLKNGEDVIVSLSFEWWKYKNIKSLIWKKWLILIEWKAWVGKTIKLLEILEYMKPSDSEWDSKEKISQKRKVPIYIALWEVKNLESLQEKIEDQSDLFWKKWYEFVYFFDGLDEIGNEETKKEVFFYAKFLSKKVKVIITSRPFSLQDSIEQKNKTEKINIKPLKNKQIKQYIKNHLTDQQKKTWEKLNKKEFLKKIETNPLMLSIACNLLVSWEKLEKIDTIWELYEEIIYSRLKDWEENKENRETNKFKIKHRMQLLSKIAYTSMCFWRILDYEDINKLIKENEIYSLIIPYNQDLYDIECLNILFKQDDGWDYFFIHESFREYFTARYYLEDIIDDKLDWNRFLLKDLMDINSKTLDFLCDFLNKEENKEKKELFLSKIKENENNFIFNKKQIFFILNKLSKENFEEYISNSIIDTNILSILEYLWWEKTLQKTEEVFLKNKNSFLEENSLHSILIKLWWNKWLKEVWRAHYKDNKNIDYLNSSNFSILLEYWSNWIKLAEKIYNWEKNESKKQTMLEMLAHINPSKRKNELEKSLKNFADIHDKINIILILLKINWKKWFEELINCYVNSDIIWKIYIIKFLLENELEKYILLIFRKVKNIEDLEENNDIFWLLLLNNKNKQTLLLAKKLYKKWKYSDIKVKTISLFCNIWKKFWINFNKYDFINKKHCFTLLKEKWWKQGLNLLKDMYNKWFIDYLYIETKDLKLKVEMMDVFYEIWLWINLDDFIDLYISLDSYLDYDTNDWHKKIILKIIINRWWKKFAKEIYFKTNNFIEKISIFSLLNNCGEEKKLLDYLIISYNNFSVEEKKEFMEVLVKINSIWNLKRVYFIENNNQLKNFILGWFLKIWWEKNRNFVQKELWINEDELEFWYWENIE